MAIAEDYNFESINIVSGNLEVRLAENSLEIDAAQALRQRALSPNASKADQDAFLRGYAERSLSNI